MDDAQYSCSLFIITLRKIKDFCTNNMQNVARTERHDAVEVENLAR